MKNIHDVMGKIFKNSDLYHEFNKHRVMYFWPDIVGERLAKFSYLDKIEQGTLFVVVTNAPWMQQIKMQSSMIIQKVNKFYGKNIVNNIRFRTGPMKKKVELPDEEYDLGKEFPFEKAHIKEEYVRIIEGRLRNVKDEKLKESLKKLALSVMKRQAFLKKEGITLCPRCKMYKDKEEKICVSCRWKEYRKEIGNIKAYIKAQPDMNYVECNAKYNCKKEDFYLAKHEVMQKYRDLNNTKDPSLEVMYIFTMLYTGKPREKLSIDYVKSYSARYRRYYD